MIGHIGEECFQAIDFTGTDSQEKILKKMATVKKKHTEI